MEVDGCARAEDPTESTSNTEVQNNLNTNEETQDDSAATAVDRVVNGETLQNGVATVSQNDVHATESTKSKKTELTSEDSTGTG